MSTIRESSHDHEGRPEQSRSTRSGKAASVKKPCVKKASAAKTQKPLPAAMEQEGKMSPVNNDVQARIADRAYELYHRRGGHQGQVLDDWFAAEQGILAEDS
jgi:hypothetical protein